MRQILLSLLLVAGLNGLAFAQINTNYGQYSGTSGTFTTTFGYQAGMSTTTGWHNVFLGPFAGRSNTTSGYNVMIGYESGFNANSSLNTLVGYKTGREITSGSTNSFFGYTTGQETTTGYQNSFFGASAGRYNTTGRLNAFIGTYAGYKNTEGFNNTAIGSQSLFNNLTGNYNVSIGTSAGYYNTADANVFVGYQSGFSSTTGVYNTMLGYQTGYANTTGGSNTYVGYGAGRNASTPINNTFLGAFAGYDVTVGHGNTNLGTSAGRKNNDGDYNVNVGYWAGSNSNGNYNTTIGVFAGNDNVAGHRNVFLGYNAGRNETGSDRLHIGNNTTKTLIYGQFDNDRVAINAIDPTATLDVNGTLRIRGGNPGTGKVLTSDANGLASWQDAPAGGGSSVWTANGSNVYYSTGNVGIGVANPQKQLHVRNLSGDAKMRFETSTNAWDIGLAAGNPNEFVISDENGDKWFILNTANKTVVLGVPNQNHHSLAVQGKITAAEIKVKPDPLLPDYVFEDDYDLMPLNEVEDYIKANKHLPGIKSAAEVDEAEGVYLGEMSYQLLEKVEELTLYLLEMKKENEALRHRVEDLEANKK